MSLIGISYMQIGCAHTTKPGFRFPLAGLGQPYAEDSNHPARDVSATDAIPARIFL